MKSYSELLRDPRWQKKRLEILQRDKFTCQHCESVENTLHVHHKTYVEGTPPWEYPNKLLITLCEECHKTETAELRTAKKLLFDALALAGCNAYRATLFAENIEDAMQGGEIPMTDEDWEILIHEFCFNLTCYNYNSKHWGELKDSYRRWQEPPIKAGGEK